MAAAPARLDVTPPPAYDRGMRFAPILALVAFTATGLSFAPLAHSAEPAITAAGTATDIRVTSDVSYKSGDALTDYEKSRCKLDIYLPASGDQFPALVWFHGGGLTGGTKDDHFTKQIVERFARSGVAVVAVNYRLSPKATYPAYIDLSASSAP